MVSGGRAPTALAHPPLAARPPAPPLGRIPSSGRPTAAFCANDLLALGLLQEMTHQRLRVPEDLAIVGYDDIEYAGAAAVPLTSVQQPRDELGAPRGARTWPRARGGRDARSRRLRYA